MRTKLLVHVEQRDGVDVFSIFFENAFVSRVKRRMFMRHRQVRRSMKLWKCVSGLDLRFVYLSVALNSAGCNRALSRDPHHRKP